MADFTAKAQRVLSSLDKMQAEVSADQVSHAFRKEVLELKAAVASGQPVAGLAAVPAKAAERAEEAAPVDIAVEEMDDDMEEGPPHIYEEALAAHVAALISQLNQTNLNESMGAQLMMESHRRLATLVHGPTRQRMGIRIAPYSRNADGELHDGQGFAQDHLAGERS